MAIAMTVECHAAIICASIPCLHIVVKRVFPGILVTAENERSLVNLREMDMTGICPSRICSEDGV